MIHALIVLSGLLWFLTAIALIKSPWCILAGCARRYDMMRSAFCFMGVLMSRYTLRWLAFPHSIQGMPSLELQVWTVLYILSCGLAVFTLIVARAHGRGDSF
jgi:hypothetical protein